MNEISQIKNERVKKSLDHAPVAFGLKSEENLP